MSSFDDLDEAAIDYADVNAVRHSTEHADIVDAFHAGADWEREQEPTEPQITAVVAVLRDMDGYPYLDSYEAWARAVLLAAKEEK